jgi:signal transduction histidine kinase
MSIRRAALIRLAIAVVLVAGVGVTGYIVTVKIADYQREQYFEVRKFQAAAAAAGLEATDVEALKGDPSDTSTAAFQKLRSQLIRVKNSDSRIRFTYLMRPQNGKMIFLVDAEAMGSRDYSLPGQVYYEAKPVEFYPFQGRAAADPWILGPIHDRWGTWISANAYVMGKDQRPVALLGTDVSVERALSSFNQIRNIGILYVILACILLGLVMLQWIGWRYNKDKREALRAEMVESTMRLNSELLETDRLKSEFIEAASHELRGPVTAVNTAIQVMDHNPNEELGKQGRELVSIAKTGSRRLVDLVNNLLDMTRIEAGGIKIEPELVDAGEIVNDTARMFTALAGEKGLKLDVDVKGEDLGAMLDAGAIKRVLENLISNAIKYTDSGSVSVGLDAAGDRLVFTVEDTGRGIPARFQDEAFKKFSCLHLSTSSDERGAGLGLAISKGLVESHGGNIRVESMEGRGSCFIVGIPRG